MFLFADYRQNAKRIGNFGIQKCSNCNNWQPQGIYEVAKQVRTFFVPVARWDKQIYVICPICTVGFPPKSEHVNDLLRESVLMPDDETARKIWDELDTFTASYLETAPSVLGAKEMQEWYEQITALTSKMDFRKEHVNRTLLSFTQYLGELLSTKQLQHE